MFQHGTHRIVHIPNCVIHHPLVNRVADVVRRSLVDAGVSVYAESTHHGVARYLQVVVECASQAAQVVLIGNCATVEPLAACLELVRERLGRELHSLWFNSNRGRTSVILGPEFQRWCGPETVSERFGGARVAEFYAGVGASGLSLLPQVHTLRLNEVSPESLRGLELGLAGLDPADRRKVEVIPGLAAAASPAATGADIGIVDPARKGLDPALLDHLRARPPGRLVYVSCGLQSFLVDAARLTEGGRLSLGSLTAFNLMPFTAHVETVACFERS